ncbi:hypothetical protein HK405_009694, partial [Cladochytrium tenue]
PNIYAWDLCKTTPDSDTSETSSQKKLFDNDSGMLNASGGSGLRRFCAPSASAAAVASSLITPDHD